MVLVLFPQESLFRDAGHSVHSSVLLVETNCPLQIIKELSTLEDNFATEAVLQKCIQTVHVLVVEKECIQFLKQLLMLPIRIMWCLQLGRKHILSPWREKQYSSLTVCFWYVFAEMKRLFFEEIVKKLGITCNILAAIWLLRRFLNKGIWKTRYHYFWYKPTKKRKRFHIWKGHVTMT